MLFLVKPVWPTQSVFSAGDTTAILERFTIRLEKQPDVVEKKLQKHWLRDSEQNRWLIVGLLGFARHLYMQKLH